MKESIARARVTARRAVTCMRIRGVSIASSLRAARVGARADARRRDTARMRMMTRTRARASDAPRTPRVLVPIARGSEEMEVVIIVDVLRRAGASVTLASVGDEDEGGDAGAPPGAVTCSRGVRVVPDARLRDVSEDEMFDLIALPGGMPGATNLAACGRLMRALERQAATPGALVGAMCASPGVVLAPRGMLDGRAATAHPAFVSALPNDASAEGRVVIDGDVITSRGPGTAIEFALALVERLFGADKAREVAGPMVLPALAERTRVANEWRLDDATVLESGSAPH